MGGRHAGTGVTSLSPLVRVPLLEHGARLPCERLGVQRPPFWRTLVLPETRSAPTLLLEQPGVTRRKGTKGQDLGPKPACGHRCTHIASPRCHFMSEACRGMCTRVCTPCTSTGMKPVSDFLSSFSPRCVIREPVGDHVC